MSICQNFVIGQNSSFTTQTHIQVRTEGTHHNIIKAFNGKNPQLTLRSMVKRWKHCLQNEESDRDAHSHFHLTPHSRAQPQQSDQKKELNWKERGKTVTAKFSKAAGYDIHMQKSAALLYSSNGLSEKASQKKKNSIYNHIKKNKILWNTKPRRWKTWTLKTIKLCREIEDDTKKQKDVLCSWTGRINVIKMLTPPKAINRFNAISIQKRPRTLFTKLEEITLNLMRNIKDPKLPKPSWEKVQSGRYHAP